MKFSKSERNTLQADNYMPPPGHYLGQDTLSLTKEQSRTTTFLKGERFMQKKLPENQLMIKTIEGFDRIAEQKSLKSTLEKAELFARNYVTRSQSQLRNKPAARKTAKGLLQQLGISPEGQIIKQKHEVLFQQLQMISNEELPGPGYYDAKVTITKPRTQNCLIKEHNTMPVKSEQPTASEIIWGESIDQKTEKTPQRTKYQAKRKDDEYNLELLLQREKIVKERNQVPPPGQYEIESQFGKIRELNLQNQCFQSRQHRFREVYSENPGPGEYEVPNTKVSNYVSRLPRKDLILADSVPVGTYTINELSKPQRKDGKFPASFGSGCVRLKEKQTLTPDPGTYDPQLPKKKLLKTVFLPKKRRQLQEQSTEQFGLGTSSDFRKPKRAKSSKIQNTHNFNSQVQRFSDQDLQSLGPGAYTIKEPFLKGTFNKASDIIGRSRRDHDLKPQKLGPGSYDCTYDTIKNRISKDIYF